MENFTKFSVLIVILLCARTGFSQAELASGYYVVVGAYADTREDHAMRFTDDLKSKGQNAQYGLNSSRNLYFVYLNYFTELKPSLEDMKSVREKGEFTDAWVRVVHGDIIAKTETADQKSEPAIQSTPVQSPVVATLVQSNEPSPQAEEKANVAELPAPTSDVEELAEEDNIVQYKQMTLGNTEVFLSLFYGTKNRVVDGEVKVIDTDHTKLITKVKGNDYLILPDPKTTSGQLTLTCEVFGYRKIQHELNYPLPLADTVKDYIDLMGTTFVVSFDLVRYRSGDIQTLYNVYFFNDASIMLPESKYELKSLLEMMKDNPNYRIRLHGHSNGNYHGKILELGPEKNFFSLEGASESIGSAKELSGQRAGIIKEYLIANGISKDRLEVKAWGGKKPLFDKHSANAKKNVRVEVEVLAD